MTESQETPHETPQPESFTKEELKRAMKAFKKRLKLTQADDESRLGHGPMSGGGASRIVAITPPNQYPEAVWKELAQQGKLKRSSRGTYEWVTP